MAKQRTKKKSALNVYSNLVNNRRTKKDHAARKRAAYLASLPKHPVKRFLYRMHPKRVLGYWFSKRGFFMALRITGVLILIGILAIGGVFAYYRKSLDAISPESLAERVQTTVTTYYDRNGKVLWEDKGTDNYRLAVESNEINDYVKKATIALEDRDFYNHDGVSFMGIARSLFNNVQGSGGVQGGSTLTQQLVKQAFFTVEEQQKRGLNGIPRKIKEIILSIEVERMYTKDQILTLYLNESSYGGRRNGIESAAQTYFGKSAQKLDLAESALLAAIPNQPGLYDPYNTAGNKALIARQHKALDDMVGMGSITSEEAEKAKKVDILSKIQPLQNQLHDVKAPHFVLMVKAQLEKELGEAIVGRGGLSVKTTLDLRIQNNLEKSMDEMFASNWPTYGGFTNGAATIEDVETGQIVALMGSRDFEYPGYGQDNAAMAHIQPGSTIKPFVYAELFKNKGSDNQNYGSGSILADDKTMDKIYGAKLQNADRKYKGSINIRKGLALSRNIPAVKAMYISGVEPTINTIRALGDTSYCSQEEEAGIGLSSAIGGCGAVQVEHVNAYATLARQGAYMPYSTVLEVKNSDGDILKKYTAEKKQVIDPQITYILADILSDDDARSGLYGKHRKGFYIPGVKTATKSGTSDKNGYAKDIWTSSFSPVLSMSVWLGNPDTRVLKNGTSAIPAMIVNDVMKYAHEEVYAKDGRWKAGDWFTKPSGVQTIKGELFPSWYNKDKAQSTKKIIFDRVSKKKATDCTPEEARIEVGVTEYTDPITKKKSYMASEDYDATKEDDVHSCSDAMPNVSISVMNNGDIKINYAAGKFSLKNLTVTVNGSTVANVGLTSSGSRTIKNQTISDSGTYEISAKVTDEGYYSSTSTTTWQSPNSN